jgi:peptidoglycan/xylan/chitin deacetylase (PgdA/CDA1 family)
MRPFLFLNTGESGHCWRPHGSAILQEMKMFLRAILVLFLLQVPAAAQSRRVALTFDDLPLALAGAPANATPEQRLAETRAVNDAILAVLKKHHAPAIAFVNEQKVLKDGMEREYRQLLAEWIRDGHDLGNHTFAHLNLSEISAEKFEQEVIDGEASIKPLMANAGKKLRFLRFPYNHTGETPEKHAAVAAFLKQRGYEVATCTVENSDWVFARAYRLALDRGDAASAARLRAAYLEYTRQELDYYTGLHRQIFGHEIPHVMLLHSSRLNADTLDQLLKIFEDEQYGFVTLAEAQSDPAYRTPDTDLTEAGPMWGYRWARELKIKVDGSKEPEVPAWVSEYK